MGESDEQIPFDSHKAFELIGSTQIGTNGSRSHFECVACGRELIEEEHGTEENPRRDVRREGRALREWCR